MITIDDNLADVNFALGEYLKHTRQNVDEAMAKQGTKLAFAISNRMANDKPGKGAIRAERLSALKGGGGIRLRKSVRDWKPTRRKRGLNIQALRVQREIGLRESGSGFLQFATRINTGKLKGGQRARKVGRYKQQLAEAGLRFQADGTNLKIVYGGPQSEFGGTLNRPRFRRHINNALAEVAEDIMVYVDRKQEAPYHGR